MPSLSMHGPYALTTAQIDANVKRKCAGNYALGYVDENRTFRVQYVGRSDSNLNARLKSWVGSYRSFKFLYATSPKAAFEKECHNFHDFGGTQELDNDIHPDRPSGSGWECPICVIFD